MNEEALSFMQEAIIERLRAVIDPETNADVIRMRLIKDLEIQPEGLVSYTFQPSSPLCPIAVFLVTQIKQAVAEVPGLTAQEIKVEGYIAEEELTKLINKEAKRMRLAISAEDNNGLDSTISHHFGRCPYFVLVDVDGEEIKEVRVIDNPYFAQHQPGMVPGYIHNQHADVMISGGMGHRAIAFFQEFGIDISTGATGTVKAAIDNYLCGTLNTAEPCRESVKHAHHHHHSQDEGDMSEEKLRSHRCER